MQKNIYFLMTLSILFYPLHTPSAVLPTLPPLSPPASDVAPTTAPSVSPTPSALIGTENSTTTEDLLATPATNTVVPSTAPPAGVGAAVPSAAAPAGAPAAVPSKGAPSLPPGSDLGGLATPDILPSASTGAGASSEDMFAFKEPQLKFIDQNIEYLKKMEKEQPSNNQLSVDLKVARERLEVARIVLLLSFADRNVAIAKRNLATAKKDKKTLKAQLQKEQAELAKSVIAERKTLSKKRKTKKSSDLDPGEDAKKEETIG